MTEERTTSITRSAPATSETGKLVEVDKLHLRLPCRSFRIAYKVAEPGKFSLTTEFLLRVLRCTDGLREEHLGEFFGFTSEEMRFVIDHAENLGYVARANGRVRLTDGGHNLFTDGVDEPALFEVLNKRERFDFDLIALAPAERLTTPTSFEYELPELSIPNEDELANASRRVSHSFKRYFQDFRFRRTGSRLEKQSLYTIDDVQPENRFSTIVPISLSVRVDSPGFPEADLTSWKTGAELEDRGAVAQSCAAFVDSVRVQENWSTEEAVEILLRCAPKELSRFLREGRLSTDGFFRAAARQAGELRSDRRTVRVIGHVWTDANRVRFAAALRNAVSRDPKRPSMMFWVRPSIASWGATTRVQEVLEAVSKQYETDDGDAAAGVRSVLVTDHVCPRRFRKVFNAIVLADGLPQGLEILLVPGRLAFVLVHTPIGRPIGYPIPLGVATFDPGAVLRVHGELTHLIEKSQRHPAHCDWEPISLLDEIDAALDFALAPGESDTDPATDDDE